MFSLGEQRWAEAASEALALLALVPSFPDQLPSAVIIWAGALLFIAATAEPGPNPRSSSTHGSHTEQGVAHPEDLGAFYWLCW